MQNALLGENNRKIRRDLSIISRAYGWDSKCRRRVGRFNAELCELTQSLR